ncbi:MarR family winged helix-turn-helix transcriptional regulator [Lysobacter korlensis]|uniref:MarR family winged helix-turn-helix transcriptional regulator n=1 Tax=Lysobacter korlensis TaxID=553636 RepID=A0ABV6RVP8_9GAMM
MVERLNEGELAAYFALRSAGDRLQQAVARQLKSHDLTEVQFSILARLVDSTSGLRMSDLARVLVVTKSGLTYQAGQLERRGLIARESSEVDDRAVVVRATPQGADLIRKVMPGHIALVRELFIDRLDPREVATVRDALSRVGAPGEA